MEYFGNVRNNFIQGPGVGFKYLNAGSRVLIGLEQYEKDFMERERVVNLGKK